MIAKAAATSVARSGYATVQKKLIHTVVRNAINKSPEIPHLKFPENTGSVVADAISMRPSPYEQPELIGSLVAEALKASLPESTLTDLRRIGSHNQPGIVLIDGFPTGDVPSGKAGESILERAKRKDFISDSAMLGITKLMGQIPYSHPNEQDGRLIHNIAPVAGKEATKSSKGRDPFYLHTENPFEDHPPHFLMLVGMEGDKSAKTSFLPVENVLDRLKPEVIEAMKEQEFTIKSGAGVDGTVSGTYPLLDASKMDRDFLRLYQDQERLEGNTDKAKWALREIKDVFSDIEHSGEIGGVGLQPGQALIFANASGPKITDSVEENVRNSVMHGKIGYTENPFRWIQRQFIVKPNES